uniref:SCP domain-containing protein n=1 Tax=Romanomermis culicivorax TaxID=13658 RepID=A0A915J2U7_ROMCU
IWDDILASKAKQWADKCILSRTSKLYINDNQEATKKNNKIKNRTLNYGENIFIAPLFNPIEEQDQLKSVVYKTMEQWFGEYIYFKYPDKCRKNKYCGHYTQRLWLQKFSTNRNLVKVVIFEKLVWSSTSKVGCAISQCLTDQKTSDSRFFLAYTMACFYDPPRFILKLEMKWPASPSHPHGPVCWCGQSDNTGPGVAVQFGLANCGLQREVSSYTPPKLAQNTTTTQSAPLCATKDPFSHPEGLKKNCEAFVTTRFCEALYFNQLDVRAETAITEQGGVGKSIIRLRRVRGLLDSSNIQK